jgi:linoleoyl-CoA desaturase
MSESRIRFPRRDPARFSVEVKEQVADYFRATGRSQKADWRMVLKTVVLLGTTVGAYALLLSNRFSAWEMLGLAVLMGVGMAGIGFSVAHDALHGAYSSSRLVNRLLGYTFDLIGANGYMWKITHNVIHHTYTNIDGVDEDLAVSPLLRLSPGAPWRAWHRWQHRYGLLTYGFATLNWVFAKDYQQFLKRDLGPYKDKKHPPSEVVHLIATKLFCYAYTIAVPLLVLRVTWWQFLIGFLALHLTAGLILGVVFQLAHVVHGPGFPVPDETGAMGSAWLVHEMETTADFAHGNRLLSWYIGGLNYQIEHHLFPQVCSIHYPALSPIVRAAAERNGVPYHYHPTLVAAIRSHLSMLEELGARPVPDLAPASA